MNIPANIAALQRDQTIVKTTTVVVTIDTAANKLFSLPSSGYTQLQGSTVYGIAVRFNVDDGARKSRAGKTLLEVAKAESAFLTIQADGRTNIKDCPLMTFKVESKNLLFAPVYLEHVDISNSQLQLAEAFSSAPTQECEITFFHL